MRLEQLKHDFNQSPFFSTVGFDINHVEEGYIILELPIENKLLNTNGVVHGGVYATMLDTVMGMTVRSFTGLPSVTINLNTNFHDAVSDGTLVATAKLTKVGYRIAMSEGKITDENNHMVASGMATFKVLRRSSN